MLEFHALLGLIIGFICRYYGVPLPITLIFCAVASLILSLITFGV